MTHDDGANHGFMFWVGVVDRRAAMERISCGMAVVTNSSTMKRYPHYLGHRNMQHPARHKTEWGRLSLACAPSRGAGTHHSRDR